VWWFNAERDLEDVPPQLLADLREAANACAVIAVLRQDKYWNGVAARVRALLPEEGET
jgi:hypothetical protein